MHLFLLEFLELLICVDSCFYKFEKFLNIISSNIPYTPFSLLSYCDSHCAYVDMLDGIPQIS